MKNLHAKNNLYSKIITLRDLESKLKTMVESPRTKIVNDSTRKEKL
jgi:hypothetical protein